jgi:hypothetical protein
MKHILLSLVVFGALAQIGCSGNKKDAQAQANACMFDPTGKCQQAAKAYAEVPGNQAGLQKAVTAQGGAVTQVPIGVYRLPDGTVTTVPPLGAAAQVPGAIAPVGSVAPPVIVQSIDGSTVKQHAAQVQAALKADSMNPESAFYDPPTSTRAPSSSTAPTPASNFSSALADAQSYVPKAPAPESTSNATGAAQ